MSALERLQALGQWRWTPFVGLAAGSAAIVVSLSALVPDRIGSVLAPPPRRSAAALALTTPTPSEPSEDLATANVPTPPPMRAATPTNVSPVERRRGFSPVIREDVPQPSEPPPEIAEAEAQVVQPKIVNADGDEQERWRRGQELGARAASRAAMRASAVAGRVARARAQGNAANEAAAESPAEDEALESGTAAGNTAAGPEAAPNGPGVSEPAVIE